MRRTFGKVISELEDKDEKIYVLVGDIGYRVFNDFREKIILTPYILSPSNIKII